MEIDIPGGYAGKILRVNLSNNSISEERLDKLFCRRYLGGTGFISYFLYRELKQGVEPLSVDNKLVFALGPVTGTPMIGSGRSAVGGKSPLSGGIALSQVGEYWGSELKRAGYDCIIIEGKAEKPAYIWVNDGEASIKDARHLWGKETKETQQAIRAELGDDNIRVAMIGPGGENQVKFACIMHGLYDTAGRGGLGAVMGSKNLKAIVVRGHKIPAVADSKRLKELRRWFAENMYNSPVVKGWHQAGTGFDMEAYEQTGELTVRNWRDGLFPGVKNISATTIKETISIGMDSCFACPIRCKKRLKFDEPYPVDPDYGGPEYESLSALGSNLGVDNVKAIVKGNELCNTYSLDTISTGGVIAFAMECFEKGLLTTEDTGGIELRFGNDAAMLKCIELIAHRDGFGNLLAEGTSKLARKIGHASEDFAIHVKGIDAGHHEPRLMGSVGLGFMVNPHGADHCCNVLDRKFLVEGGMKAVRPLGFLEPFAEGDMGPRKVALFVAEHLKQVILDCMLMCHLAAVPLNHKVLTDITEAVTGWDTGVVEMLRIAERALTMTRLFNLREGLTADDDRLPKRFFQPKTDGPLDNRALDPEKMEKAKRYYYTLMGWDKDTGVPLPEKIEELCLPATFSGASED
jgi:aldehyde:ferredoxin oxidoreductase